MQNQFQKLLLMGPGGAGKTCMRSIIFDNYLPRDVLRLSITISLDQTQVHMFNNLYLNLWDCGGQQRYAADYLSRQKESIFRSVSVMLFVFDINSMKCESDELHSGMSMEWSTKDMLNYFKSAVHYVRHYSPHAKIFVLLHKIDLIASELREKIFEARKAEIISYIKDDEATDNIRFFATTIWSNSLYLAYSSIVRSLVPHINVLRREMKKLLVCCNAVEVGLYERSTFLCVTHVSRKSIGNGGSSTHEKENNWDDFCGGDAENDEASTETDSEADTDDRALESSLCELRTTLVSETVKQFKLSCMNNGTSLDGFMIRTKSFTALLHPFTSCTHVLVVSTDTTVNVELHRCNVRSARRRFDLFLSSEDPIAKKMRHALR